MCLTLDTEKTLGWRYVTNTFAQPSLYTVPTFKYSTNVGVSAQKEKYFIKI